VTPGDLSRQINSMIADALKIAKASPGIKTQTGNTSTYPVYSAKGGKIESWHMRSELVLESTNIAALSELLGKLQGSLAVSSVVLQPSPETRKKVENDAMLEALGAFKTRAKVIADAMGQALPNQAALGQYKRQIRSTDVPRNGQSNGCGCCANANGSG
jgi:predicted secreted protein